jgi:hypothetical protein
MSVTQHPQDVIEDATIMLGVVDLAERQAGELELLRVLADACGDLDAEMVGVGSTQSNEFVIVRASAVNRIHEAWVKQNMKRNPGKLTPEQKTVTDIMWGPENGE